MRIVRIKEIVDCTGNTIYLAKCTDTKQTDTDSEKRKNLCQPLPFYAHTLLDIVERSAKAVSILRYDAVLDSEQTF